MKKVISDQELKTILERLSVIGEQELYAQTKSKALFVMDQIDDLDEAFLDIHDTILEKARGEEQEEIAKDYHTVARIFRRVAHEIYRKYIKGDEQRKSERFLRIVK